MSAVALVCTLRHVPGPTGSEAVARHMLAQFAQHGVIGDTIRVVDFELGAAQPATAPEATAVIGHALRDADIVLIATPTWLGHMSSVAARVLDRLESELRSVDPVVAQRVTRKVAVAAVVGNERGAHRIIAGLRAGLTELGFTVPALGGTYDSQSTEQLVRDAVRLARLLASREHPAVR
jgi:NAD(P)H-dependent FMN reductase